MAFLPPFYALSCSGKVGAKCLGILCYVSVLGFGVWQCSTMDYAPHATALLIIDMINDLDFEGGEEFREPVEAAAPRIVALRKAGVPGDTVASESDAHRRWALEIMRHSMCAETRPTTELALTDWLSRSA